MHECSTANRCIILCLKNLGSYVDFFFLFRFFHSKIIIKKILENFHVNVSSPNYIPMVIYWSNSMFEIYCLILRIEKERSNDFRYLWNNFLHNNVFNFYRLHLLPHFVFLRFTNYTELGFTWETYFAVQLVLFSTTSSIRRCTTNVYLPMALSLQCLYALDDIMYKLRCSTYVWLETSKRNVNATPQPPSNSRIRFKLL